MNADYLKTIEAKLTGNIDEDFKFLMNEAQHFQKLELFDVVRDIFKLFEKKYENDGKTYLINKAKEAQAKRKEIYKNILNLGKEKKYLEAQEELVKLIDTFPIKRDLKENEVLKSFPNVFEDLYFNRYMANGKKVIKLEEPYADYFFSLGFILFNLEDYEGAIEEIDNSLKYNDVSPDAYLLKALCYSKIGDDNNFKLSIKIGMEHAYTRFQLANAYYQLSKYYIKKGNKALAQANLYLSMNYAKPKDIDVFTKTIDEMEGESIQPNEVEKMKAILDENNIQFGPSRNVLMLLVTSLKLKPAQDNLNIKKLFLNMLYELTHDEKYKRELDSLKPQNTK